MTLKGLEDQLLVDVVRYERPDLEQRKDKLIVSISQDKRQLKEVRLFAFLGRRCFRSHRPAGVHCDASSVCSG